MLTILISKDILPEAKAALIKHGCILNPYDTYNEIVFPEGTTRKEILPRMPQSERYTLVLPDGYAILEMCVRHLEQSVLYYSPY